jgi:hypothetical protein
MSAAANDKTGVAHRVRTLALVAVGLTLAVLGSGCASKTSVSSQWIDRDKGSAPYQRILVVGVAESRDRRVSFEAAVVEDLRVDPVKAWISANLMGEDMELSEANLNMVAKQKKADAIIITRVASIQVEPVEFGGRSEIIAEEQQSGQDYVFRRQKGSLFRYDFDEKIEDTFVTTEYTTELETDVYDLATGKRVYTLRSRATKQETLDDVISVLSDEIAKRLRRDRVIR